MLVGGTVVLALLFVGREADRYLFLDPVTVADEWNIEREDNSHRRIAAQLSDRVEHVERQHDPKSAQDLYVFYGPKRTVVAVFVFSDEPDESFVRVTDRAFAAHARELKPARKWDLTRRGTLRPH